MKKLLVCIMMMGFLAGARAQRSFDIDLWQGGLPNSNGRDMAEPFNAATQNFRPSMRVYLPADSLATGAAVVCCPGGGYTHLALGHEGNDWAPWFLERGIAFVVLTYRMPYGHWEVPLSDAREALRIVRDRARKWRVDPRKVGVMGASAGGHLASTVATHCDSASAPAFQILLYPVITMDVGTHGGSRENLLGRNADPELRELYSNEKQVGRQTPPAILLLSADDRTVPPLNSLNYFLSLVQAGVKGCALHVYPSGGHGWGFRSKFAFHEQMLAELDAWLGAMGLRKK